MSIAVHRENPATVKHLDFRKLSIATTGDLLHYLRVWVTAEGMTDAEDLYWFNGLTKTRLVGIDDELADGQQFIIVPNTAVHSPGMGRTVVGAQRFATATADAEADAKAEAKADATTLSPINGGIYNVGIYNAPGATITVKKGGVLRI